VSEKPADMRADAGGPGQRTGHVVRPARGPRTTPRPVRGSDARGKGKRRRDR
jgi:hypothetical protein